jgi:hypothetical protein
MLLDMNPDAAVQDGIQQVVDRFTDLRLWRLGPGHLGAIVSVNTEHGDTPATIGTGWPSSESLSHFTVKVQKASGRYCEPFMTKSPTQLCTFPS